MQKVIYADVLIFVNSVITFLILLTTAEILNINSEKIRFISGSFVGGFLSMIILAPAMNLFMTVLTKLIICVIIVVISFKIKSLKMMFKIIVGFFLISLLYAGFTAFIYYSVSENLLYFNNGITYFELNSISIITITALIFLFLYIINRYLIKNCKEKLIYSTVIEYKNNKINTKSFYDSGNSVRDIYTGKPVIILELSIGSELLPDELKSEIYGYFNKSMSESFPEGIRLLPVRTLGEMKLLPAFTADRCEIYNDSYHKIINNPCIALNENSFENKSYHALINSDIIGQVI